MHLVSIILNFCSDNYMHRFLPLSFVFAVPGDPYPIETSIPPAPVPTPSMSNVADTGTDKRSIFII